MAPHRFWRVNCQSNGYGGYPSLAEVAFAAAVGGASVTAGGTALASDSFGGYPPFNGCDGNPATWWNGPQALPQWWGYDFGAGSGVDVAEVRLTARSDSQDGANTAPSAWTLDWSDDGTTWTTARGFTSAPWSPGAVQAFDVDFSSVRVTQAGAETWASSTGAGLRVSQAGAEAWASSSAPQLRTSQAGAEAWASRVAPPVRASQAGAEAWASNPAAFLHTTQAGGEVWLDVSAPYVAPAPAAANGFCIVMA